MDYSTIKELLKAAAKEFPARTFLEIKRGLRTHKYSFEEIDELSSKAASYFRKKAKKGDRMILWAPNSPEWVICFFGAMKLGLVVVPIDARTTQVTAEKFIKDTQPKIILVSDLIRVTFKKTSIESAIEEINSFEPFSGNDVSPDDLAEIIFTSGTTGVPKGVMLTHRNLVSAVKSMVGSFHAKELKTISILPLSHIFEQVGGLLCPLAKGARIAYLTRINSATIMEGINRHKITCLLAVPRMLALLLASVERKAEKEKKLESYNSALAISKNLPFGLRKIIFSKVHRAFGGKLEYIFCGGAPLEERICHTWENMGFHVIQGYGSTETSGLTTFNFEGAKRSGYAGMAAPGITIKLGNDNEVLVKGDSVSPGYWKKKTESFEKGWYKTGDIGKLEGQWLKLLGREKFRIVLSDGRKVYPEDIETKFGNHKMVDAVCVVPIIKNNEKIAYASIISKNPKKVSEIVQDVNKNLEPAEQIMNFGAWPGEDFPRTRTLKADREAIRLAVQAKEDKKPSKVEKIAVDTDNLTLIISRIAKVPVSKVKDNANLVTDLKLDSLGRVELISQIEEELGVVIEESKISADTTVRDIKKLAANSEITIQMQNEYWSQKPFFVWLRWFLQRAIAFPYYNIFTRITVSGKENLDKAKGPCFYYVNHIGSLDLFVTLRVLGGSRTRNLVVAADSRAWKDVPYYAFLFELLAGAVKIDREGINLRQSLEYFGRRVDEGKSILIFPEGKTSPSGELLPFMKGAGLIAVEMGIPVVPLKNGKAYQEAFPYDITWKAIIPHGIRKVEYKIGEPIIFPKDTMYEEATKIMEDKLRNL